MADKLKAEGNAAFSAKDFPKAIDLFTQAIEIDPTNHVFYSNRSACHASMKNFDAALSDAEKTTELKPDWGKGFSRKGAALHGQGDLVGAVDAYEQALKLEPTNAQAKSGLASVNEAIRKEAAADGATPDLGLGSMFNDPQLFQKLAANPKTSGLLADPDMMRKIQELQRNPTNINAALTDPRMMQVIAVLLGIDVQMGERPEGSGSEQDTTMPDAPKSQAPPPREPTPEPEPEDEDAKLQRENKEKADKEKALGTEQYKKRNFDAAIEHYGKAWELHKDVTYLTNMSAARFEAGDYEGCIKDCEKAISEGREIYADFKIIAKALGRIGSAYQKMGDLAKAVDYYNRSLTEHRTPDILAKLRAAEKEKTTRETSDYIDADKAEEARVLGNDKFKEANWPEAVQAYTEMIKRAPSDPRGYSNRAAALQKLMSFPDSIRDCDAALKLDPSFMRAYIRKAQAYFGMREYNKVLDVLASATAADKDNKNYREIEELSQKTMQVMYSAREGETEEQTMERIQRDPEILGIIQDPVMQTILQQAKNDPAALQEHMKNPTVRTRVQKLMAAGVIRIGR